MKGMEQSADIRPTPTEKTGCRLEMIKTYYLKKPVKILLSYLLYYTGIVWIYDKYFRKGSIQVLAYHSINNRKLRPLEMEHSPESFKGQMEYLKKNYTVLSLDDFLACKKKMSFPPRSVLITFDDGFRDNYTYAYPVLKALDMPAVIFIAPQFIDNSEAYYFDVIRHLIQENIGKTIDLQDFGLGRYYLWDNEMYLSSVVREITVYFKSLPPSKQRQKLTVFLGIFGLDLASFCKRKLNLSWGEIQEMSQGGVDFGSHTFSHAHLASVSQEQCLNELSVSKKIIEEKVQKKALALAYPFGSRDAFSRRVEDDAQQIGFEVGFSLINEESDSDAFTFGRKMIDSHATDSMGGNFCKPLFASELAGLI